MRNFRLTLSYDGTDFSGWQTQPGRRTVQQTLEEAIAALTGESRVRVNASGRTDTGVHAVGQVVNFKSGTRLEPPRLLPALNAHLPDDVRVLCAEHVPDDFDANRDAVRKLYRYVIHDGDVPDLFWRRYCHHCRYRLDAAAMAAAAEALQGTHDFRCFETEWPNRASSVRTITHIAVHRIGEGVASPFLLTAVGQAFQPDSAVGQAFQPDSAVGQAFQPDSAVGQAFQPDSSTERQAGKPDLRGDWLWLDVEADGFLYNMVRAIAGTLINVGRGFWPVGHVAQIVVAGDRTQAGPTAPARGLFLMRVSYA